jgi:hypothetical protein
MPRAPHQLLCKSEQLSRDCTAHLQAVEAWTAIQPLQEQGARQVCVSKHVAVVKLQGPDSNAEEGLLARGAAPVLYQPCGAAGATHLHDVLGKVVLQAAHSARSIALALAADDHQSAASREQSSANVRCIIVVLGVPVLQTHVGSHACRACTYLRHNLRLHQGAAESALPKLCCLARWPCIACSPHAT